MAHHASAKKALRQSVKHNLNNKSRTSEVKTFFKKVEQAIVDKNLSEAGELFKAAQAKIMRAVGKSTIKKNTASRRISRLALKLKAIAN